MVTSRASCEPSASTSATALGSGFLLRSGLEDPVVAAQPPARVDDDLLADVLEACLPADGIRRTVGDPWEGVDVAPAPVLAGLRDEHVQRFRGDATSLVLVEDGPAGLAPKLAVRGIRPQADRAHRRALRQQLDSEV